MTGRPDLNEIPIGPLGDFKEAVRDKNLGPSSTPMSQQASAATR